MATVCWPYHTGTTQLPRPVGDRAAPARRGSNHPHDASAETRAQRGGAEASAPTGTGATPAGSFDRYHVGDEMFACTPEGPIRRNGSPDSAGTTSVVEVGLAMTSSWPTVVRTWTVTPGMGGTMRSRTSCWPATATCAPAGPPAAPTARAAKTRAAVARAAGPRRPLR